MAPKRRLLAAIPATSAQALDFVRKLQSKFQKQTVEDPLTEADREVVRKYLAGFEPAFLRGIAQRLVSDLHKPPQVDEAKAPPRHKRKPLRSKQRVARRGQRAS